jgi:hypothetical protein
LHPDESRGYRTDEPNGLLREESVIWKTVFTELWTDRISKSKVAADLHLPTDELENLVFGLAGAMTPPGRSKGTPNLKAV